MHSIKIKRLLRCFVIRYLVEKSLENVYFASYTVLCWKF